MQGARKKKALVGKDKEKVYQKGITAGWRKVLLFFFSFLTTSLFGRFRRCIIGREERRTPSLGRSFIGGVQAFGGPDKGIGAAMFNFERSL